MGYGKNVKFTPENRRDVDELLQLQSENDLKRLLLRLGLDRKEWCIVN